MREIKKAMTIMEWQSTHVLKRNPWGRLMQLWVRVRLVEYEPKDELDTIRQEEVVDTEWRQV